MDEKTDRFYIYPYIEGGGRAAIAVDFDRISGVVLYAVAWCSPKDQFNRKRGRVIAEGRLKVGKHLGFPTAAKSRRDVVLETLEDLASNLDRIAAPMWVERFEDKRFNDGRPTTYSN